MKKGEKPEINIFTITFSRWPVDYGMSLTKRRTWESPKGEGDEGEPDDQGTGANPVKKEEAPDPKPSSEPGDDSSLAWVAGRIERAENKARADLLRALGYESQDDLKTALEELTGIKRDQMTAQEKLQADLLAAKQLAESKDATIAELQEEIQEMAQARTLDTLKAAIRQAADEANAQYPEDVVGKAFADGLVDTDKMVKDDGSIDTEPIDGIIEKVRDSRPDWFGRRASGSPSTAGGRNPDLDAKQRKARREAVRRTVRTRF